MKTIKKVISVLILTVFCIIISTTDVQAKSKSSLFLENLNFDAVINNDGSMNVTEYWDIEVENTNTLFKTFKVDKSKYSGITDVKVSDITKGEITVFKQTNQEMYHVTKNYYYSLLNSKGDFEIAWGVGLDDSSARKKYKIEYKVKDVVSKNNDYAELYWQFIGKDFEVDVAKIKGTIKLPKPAGSKEDVRVWGHTEDLNGDIHVTELDKIEFNLNNFNNGKYVEIRALLPISMIQSSGRTSTDNVFDKVIEEESKWANEANSRRDARNQTNLLISTVIMMVALGISILIIKKIVKDIRKLKGLQKINPSQEIIYFREIPRENASPAEAVYILNKKLNSFTDSQEIGKIFSASLLDFNLKKLIEFEQSPNKKDEFIIKLINTDETILNENLEEKEIFIFLKKAFKNKTEIKVKELERYIENSPTKTIDLKEKIDTKTNQKVIKEGLQDERETKQYSTYQSHNIMLIVLIVFTILGLIFTISRFNPVLSIIGLATLLISSIIAIIVNTMIMSKTNTYTQKGIDEKQQWIGLKKYMEEFSMLDKREVPEIVLWEKFLVYATAFGIANKVLKQLKIVYPNLEEQINIGTYSYMYLMTHTNFTSSFSNSISSSMSASYSSGSGGGGGFSGGGGGGRWPEAVEVVDNTTKSPFYIVKEVFYV